MGMGPKYLMVLYSQSEATGGGTEAGAAADQSVRRRRIRLSIGWMSVVALLLLA